jgi:hypothetical protein
MFKDSVAASPPDSANHTPATKRPPKAVL